MSYDVYWVKNRAEKIADFEHPTRRGTNTSRMISRMIVGPASRNQESVRRIVYPTAALLRSLQWVSDGYVSPRDTALIERSAMGGCVATAGRHSLLCLSRLL